MQRAIIVDLDGTIADDRWRRSRIREGTCDQFTRYHDYHSLAAFDALGNRELLEVEHRVLVVTARPEHYRVLTEEWLRRTGARWSALYMRAKCDTRGSVKLKEDILRRIDSELVVHAYDDRPDIVAMYRSHGVPATVVTL